MRIQHNIMAMNAYRNYNNNTSALSKNLEKLSSGYKINRAGDDAAGLAISEKMRAQITGLNAAQKNVKDGISLVKTAEGAMQEIQDMLNRMDYLATQSANGTYDNEVDRVNLQKEVDALKTEINRIADSANFNGIKLLDGSQAEVAATNESFVVSAAGTFTGGETQRGGTATNKLADNFVTASGHYGMHEGQPSRDQATASFTIDLKDFVAKSTATNAASVASVTISFAGITLAATFAANAAGTAALTAGALASAFAATGNVAAGMVSIGGMYFSVSNQGSKLVFTVSTGATGMSDYGASVAASVNALISGADVNITVGGDGGTKEGNWHHGLEDVTAAAEKLTGELAGISFTIDGDVVKDGNTLKIGDTLYSFKTVASGSLATNANGAKVIDVSKFTGTAQWTEAARQMALATNNTPTYGGTVNGVGGTNDFHISVVSGTNGNVIHIDQNAVTSGDNKQFKEADLKNLFALTEPTVAASSGSLTVTAGGIAVSGASGAFTPSAGDVFSLNGKNYTIVADASDATKAEKWNSQTNIKITADDFTKEVQKYALKTAVDSVKGSHANLDFTIASDGMSVSVTLGANGTMGVDDDAAILGGIQNDILTKMADIKVSRTDGAASGTSGLKLQIGDTSDSFNQMSVKIGDMHTKAMGTGKAILDGTETDITDTIADIDISSQAGAQSAVNVIKNAINYVSGIRGDLGAIQNRLEHTQSNLSVMAENIQDAESTIRDTDVAEEMMSYVKNNILVQSAQAMLAQANQVPQGVLQLLG